MFLFVFVIIDILESGKLMLVDRVGDDIYKMYPSFFFFSFKDRVSLCHFFSGMQWYDHGSL